MYLIDLELDHDGTFSLGVVASLEAARAAVWLHRAGTSDTEACDNAYRVRLVALGGPPVTVAYWDSRTPGPRGDWY